MEVPLHPDAVEFDEVECCAMERASVQEVHQQLIREYITSLGEIHPVYRASLLLGIFKNTFFPVFVPTDVQRILYARLASAEKATFEKSEDHILECGHLVTEHWRALDAVCVKMMSSQEGNESIREVESAGNIKIPPVPLNRKMNLMAGSHYAVPRVTHRAAHRKKMPRFKIKCGCCDQSFDIYYDGLNDLDLTEASLEVANVNASVEDWRAILLPLLGFERQGDSWVDTGKDDKSYSIWI